MRFPQLALATLLASPLTASAQSAPPAVNYGASPGGQIVAPVNVTVPTQNIQYLNPIPVPATATPAPSDSRCVLTGYAQQTTGAGAFGGQYTSGLSFSCPI